MRGSIPPPSTIFVGNIMNAIKENVTIDPKTKCWNWNKSVTSAGYGQLTRNGRYWTTHRYVMTCMYGPITRGLIVRHKCNNTKCCNPDHLMFGSHRDNWWDSENRHRNAANKRALGLIINGIKYRTLREANAATKISVASLIKYTSIKNRIFDIPAYKIGCLKANKIPPSNI